MSMPERIPQQIQWKFYRAKQHYDELRDVLREYWKSTPVKLNKDPHTPNGYIVQSETDPPARFGLIAGDFLQNVRSCLDYLVWQLVIANCETPNRGNQFPVCDSPGKWKENMERNRLAGVHPDAIDLIRSFQPCFDEESTTAPHPLSVLEELVNENKHRQVLFTAIALGQFPSVRPPVAFAEYQVTRMGDGKEVPGERLVAFLTFKGGSHTNLKSLVR